MIASQLLAALLSTPNPVAEYHKLGLRPELFKGLDEESIYKTVSEHVMQYGQLPSAETLTEKTGYAFPATVPEPPAYYRDKMVARHVHLSVKTCIAAANEMIKAQDPHKALSILRDTALNLHIQSNASRIVDFAADGKKIIFSEMAKKQAEGEDYGVKMGWPFLDSLSGGLMGGDVLSIVGRPGMGKTYMMLYAALHAWDAKKKPLFVSMEMTPLLIMQRLAAISTHTSVAAIKHGTLTTHGPAGNIFKKLQDSLEENKSKSPFWIVDGALTAQVDDLVLYCHEFKPDVLYVDGAYLLRSNSRVGRWERLTEIAEKVKSEIAEALHIPVVISYQLNRGVDKLKKGEEVGLHNIAFTDAIGQLSSIVLALLQEDSVETLKKRQITILKGRSGESGKFDINWQFDGPNYMDFSEYVEKQVSDLQFI